MIGDPSTVARRGQCAQKGRVTDPAPTTIPFVANRLTLNLVDWGNAGAPPLVLVHGGGDHARSWDAIARMLRDEWHVICPDLRGHGDSAWSGDGDYALPAFVADLVALLRLTDDRPVSIVGHSLGGAIALRAAALYPDRVRRVAALEGLGRSPADPPDARSAAARWRGWIEERDALFGRQPYRYPTLDSACARLAAAHPSFPADWVRHLAAHGTRREDDGTYAWKHDRLVRAGSPGVESDDDRHRFWHAIHCPVWLVHGRDSWAHDPAADGRAARFRQARVTSYHRAGHWMHHDRRDDFVTDLRAFLR